MRGATRKWGSHRARLYKKYVWNGMELRMQCQVGTCRSKYSSLVRDKRRQPVGGDK